MTETTTAEGTLLDDAAQAAADAQSKSLATVRADQQRFDDNQIAILRQLGIEDASQGDLDLFFHYCRTTGLDPFRKQIYMIGRNTKVVEWVDQGGRREKQERWVTKYTIQTGIDGYRRNGREAAKALGDTISFDGPYWCGDDGQWVDVWVSRSAPFAAKFTVIRNGEKFTGVAHFDEFVQTNAIYEGTGQSRRKTGEEPNSMWAKMPRNQIAKCAEALAWRRAYPDDFSGLILEDTAQSTVIDQDGNPETVAPQPRQRPAGGGLRSRARAAQDEQQEPMDVETVDVPDDKSDAGEGKSARQKWNDRMFQLFTEAKVTDRDEQLTVIAAITGKPAPEHRNELPDDDLKSVVTKLNAWAKAGQTDAEIREILNAAVLKAENIEIKGTEQQ